MATGFANFYGGIAWPETLQSRNRAHERIMGTAGFEVGKQFASVVALGGLFEYSGKGKRPKTIDEVFIDSNGSTEIIRETLSVKRLIYSTGLSLRISPFPDWKIRPETRAAALPSLMVLINDGDTMLFSNVLPQSGVYGGMLYDFQGDVAMVISPEVAITVGGGYRFGSVRKQVESDNETYNETYNEPARLYRQSLEGAIIRSGIMVK